MEYRIEAIKGSLDVTKVENGRKSAAWRKQNRRALPDDDFKGAGRIQNGRVRLRRKIP
jgi:hypothetical protein